MCDFWYCFSVFNDVGKYGDGGDGEKVASIDLSMTRTVADDVTYRSC